MPLTKLIDRNVPRNSSRSNPDRIPTMRSWCRVRNRSIVPLLLMRLRTLISRSGTMERFLTRHQDRIVGILSGFDRLLFRGTLRSISFVKGMDGFLGRHHIWYKHFGAFAEQVSNRIKAHAEVLAAQAGRPFLYLASAKQVKEAVARDILVRDRITDGLFCILSCVEPCQSFTLRRDQQLADALTDWPWAQFLERYARQVNPWAYAKSTALRPYYWTLRQGEYATDVVFRDAAALEAVYPRLLHHAIEHFGADDVLRFLGRRLTGHFTGEACTTLQRRREGRRIKHWIDENSIKMYDKAGCLLRIETTLNNPRRFRVRRRIDREGHRELAWLPLRKSIADLRRRVEISRAANARYLDALSVVGEITPSHHLLDSVSHRVLHDGRPYRPLHPVSPLDAPLFRVLLDGKFSVQGIRNRDLRLALYPDDATDPLRPRRSAARITRCLRLLRAHGLLRKVPTTRYYRLTVKGHAIMTTALNFRDADLALLAA